MKNIPSKLLIVMVTVLFFNSVEIKGNTHKNRYKKIQIDQQQDYDKRGINSNILNMQGDDFDSDINSLVAITSKINYLGTEDDASGLYSDFVNLGTQDDISGINDAFAAVEGANFNTTSNSLVAITNLLNGSYGILSYLNSITNISPRQATLFAVHNPVFQIPVTTDAADNTTIAAVDAYNWAIKTVVADVVTATTFETAANLDLAINSIHHAITEYNILTAVLDSAQGNITSAYPRSDIFSALVILLAEVQNQQKNFFNGN
jgi:hypothetical protein